MMHSACAECCEAGFSLSRLHVRVICALRSAVCRDWWWSLMSAPHQHFSCTAIQGLGRHWQASMKTIFEMPSQTLHCPMSRTKLRWNSIWPMHLCKLPVFCIAVLTITRGSMLNELCVRSGVSCWHQHAQVCLFDGELHNVVKVLAKIRKRNEFMNHDQLSMLYIHIHMYGNDIDTQGRNQIICVHSTL